MLGISDEAAIKYRLYDGEIIELNKDVSFILLLPPQDQFMSEVAGSVDRHGLMQDCTALAKPFVNR